MGMTCNSMSEKRVKRKRAVNKLFNQKWEGVANFLLEGNRKVQKYFIVGIEKREKFPRHKHRMCCFCECKTTVEPFKSATGYGSVKVNMCLAGGFTIQTNGTCKEFTKRRYSKTKNVQRSK